MDKEMMGFYKSALLGVVTNKPLCNEYKNEWRACGDDKIKLVTFSLRQQCIPFVMTYSYNKQGLSKEYLKKEYNSYINGAYCVKNADGVQDYTYMLNVDYKGEYARNIDVSSFMYCKDTNIIVPQTKCPSYFVGCKSNVTITLEGYNSIRVYLYDESCVTIDNADENSDITIYKYSDKAHVEVGKFCFAKVREFTKDLRLQL